MGPSQTLNPHSLACEAAYILRGSLLDRSDPIRAVFVAQARDLIEQIEWRRGEIVEITESRVAGTTQLRLVFRLTGRSNNQYDYEDRSFSYEV